MVFLYITCQSNAEAKGLAQKLLARRAVGNVNLFPILSLKRTDGEIKESSEVAVLVETSDQKVQEIEEMVRELHTIPRVCTVAMFRLNREHKEWLTTHVA